MNVDCITPKTERVLYDPIVANEAYLNTATPGTILYERIHRSPTAITFKELTKSFQFKTIYISYLITSLDCIDPSINEQSEKNK